MISTNYIKYRLVLGGDIAHQFSKELIKHLIELWVIASGAKNVSSGVVQCDMDSEAGVAVYSIHFDSSHWTGIDFKGFDHKRGVEPQTA